MPCIVLHYSALLQGHHALIAAGGCIQPEFDWTYVMSCLIGPQLIALILWLNAAPLACSCMKFSTAVSLATATAAKLQLHHDAGPEAGYMQSHNRQLPCCQGARAEGAC